MDKKPRTKTTKLSRTQLEAYIREGSQDTSKVFFTEHIFRQMRARRITKSSVLDVLRNGKMNRAPEPNHMKGNLECAMENYCAGHHIRVVVAVSDDDPDLILVTAMHV